MISIPAWRQKKKEKQRILTKDKYSEGHICWEKSVMQMCNFHWACGCNLCVLSLDLQRQQLITPSAPGLHLELNPWREPAGKDSSKEQDRRNIWKVVEKRNDNKLVLIFTVLDSQIFVLKLLYFNAQFVG